MNWGSEDLGVAYARLSACGVPFVIVGGQAVNLWAEYFRARSKTADWDSFLPFASHDLDLLGGRVDVASIGSFLQLEYVIFPPMERSDAPNTGTLYLPIEGRDDLIVQFIHTPFGTNPIEVSETAQHLEWNALQLPVMHPLLCLESKVACLCQLDQRTRQDEKHARLSLLILRDFLIERVLRENEGELRQIIRRVVNLTLDERGLRLWHENGLRCEDSLPISILRETASGWPKLGGFIEQEWPRRMAEISERRERYAAVVARQSRK